jgi:outer membrane protein insertion porin family
MRIFVGILFLSTILNTGRGQEPVPVLLKSDAKVQIHKLTIDANNLPNEERERITRSFEHSIFTFEGELQQEFKDEFWERIRQAFQDLGYFKARVDEPKISFLRQTQGTEDINVSVKVDQGTQYRLGEIQFQKASVFPADRMRPLFQLQAGDLFARTAVIKGLDELRKLYATEGYINCVVIPVPQINESHRTIDLVLDIDDGKPFDFGRLFLNATEPHPDAYKALMESWKTLQGKRYSPLLLKSWLTANASEWPGSRDLDRIVDYLQHPESHTVDIKLQLQ